MIQNVGALDLVVAAVVAWLALARWGSRARVT